LPLQLDCSRRRQAGKHAAASKRSQVVRLWFGSHDQ
jgi:hypothetical protein